MTGIPIDLMLPLPAALGLLKILLVVTFIVHILFVGLMVGGAFWSVIFRLLGNIPGKENPFFDRLAHEILSTVTVTKSLAVVLGVAPLLLIGLAYTRYWYSANMITASAFLSIIWLVIVAFLLLYIYKYQWDALNDKVFVHVGIGALACGIFSIIPLIFLSNINLMLLPVRWDSTRGFVDALFYANVIPRYLHFMVAAFTAIGFFAAAYFWYGGKNMDDPFYPHAQKVGLKWALVATLLQAIFGPLLFFTLPAGSHSKSLLILVAISIALVALICIALIRALRKAGGGPILVATAALLCVTALLMSFQRHVVRENLLREPHQIAEQRTEDYKLALASFMETYSPEDEAALTGDTLFKRYCTSCHAQEERLVGPPISYMVTKYAGKEKELAAYTLNPVKINDDYPSMPKSAASKDEVAKIVSYVFATKPQKTEKPKPTKAESAPEKKSAQARPEGETLFKRYCTVCHAQERRLVGPPVTYMVTKYAGKEQEMSVYISNPVRVDEDYPSMPKTTASDEEIAKIARYLLGAEPQGAEESKPTKPTPAPEVKPVKPTPNPKETLAEIMLERQAAFKQHCAVCHAQDRRLVGPSIDYMIEKYSGKREEMIEYVHEPVKIDPNYPPMPKQSIEKEQIIGIVDYILRVSE